LFSRNEDLARFQVCSVRDGNLNPAASTSNEPRHQADSSCSASPHEPPLTLPDLLLHCGHGAGANILISNNFEAYRHIAA